ncbi:Phage integrase family protein [Planctomycetes bacterium MalM25]|nr:Phage integrase family protein [Planctomycetes bacterium MalM25]
MGKKQSDTKATERPRVRIACPSGRPIQLRYVCPETGRPVRVSTGTREVAEAEVLRAEMEARLLLGQEARPEASAVATGDARMPWDEFREHYRRLHLSTLREGSAEHAETRLDIATRLLKPKRLGDLGAPSALAELQARLLAGEQSLRGKPRSPHTVRGYMGAILAAMNWAYLQGWLDEAPRLRKLRAARGTAMRGRPISEEEFARLLETTESVVGLEGAASWRHVLEGLWNSSLRLGELLAVSWDQAVAIRPVWPATGEPELVIPGALQKNGRNESIPLLPWFETLLLKTPVADRHGWIFNPASLQNRMGRRSARDRPSTAWVGKVISRIGKQAGVVVEEADSTTGRPTKYASAHDLRRSCGERLREAGVPPLIICRVMRHSSWETTQRHYAPGNIQNEAGLLRRLLTEEAAT